jgi:hypothetical protein
MKKVFVGILTFAIGVSFSSCLYFLDFSDARLLEEIETEDNLVETVTFFCPVDIEPEIAETNNDSGSPFFESFGKTEYVNDEYQGYSGWFIPDEFVGMNEIWTLLLSRDNENSKTGKMTWNATLLTQDKDHSPNDEDNFVSTTLKAEKNKLSFQTNRIRGVEYKFEGTFIRGGKDFEEDEKVLKSTLRKYIKGKKIAEFTADFAYHEPTCWH